MTNAAMSISVGSNVVSLLGARITEIPSFPDRRGPAISFRLCLRDSMDVVMMTGTRTVFGLVLHRRYHREGDPPVWANWTISEPTTGMSLAHGSTRREALEDLAMKVAFHGGKDAFKEALRDATQRALAGEFGPNACTRQ